MKDSENSNEKGLVFNIQKFSLHDGPGIRTTVFMKGCPLSCKWCSNPESMNQKPEIMTRDLRCIGCRKCEEACPRGAISFGENGRTIDWANCDNCLVCSSVCPAGAIVRVGDLMSIEEVVKKVEDDAIFYKNSGGGVTLSGGEPLLQWKFVREVLRRCREKNIHTALDTTGYASWDHIEKVTEFVDLVLFDIKHMDNERHKEGTGVDNSLILKNAERVAARVETWFRFPIIPGFNDSDENVRLFSEFALKSNVKRVSLLPYHQYGSAKYPNLGRTYPMEGTVPPDDDAVERISTEIERFDLNVSVGG